MSNHRSRGITYNIDTEESFFYGEWSGSNRSYHQSGVQNWCDFPIEGTEQEPYHYLTTRRLFKMWLGREKYKRFMKLHENVLGKVVYATRD